MFNVATGRRVSLNETPPCRLDLHAFSPSTAPERGGDIKHSLADISKAQPLGYKPKVDFEEGLRCTVDWYRRK
jgi:nucleoside-diphosphate-sugar epimerase